MWSALYCKTDPLNPIKQGLKKQKLSHSRLSTVCVPCSQRWKASELCSSPFGSHFTVCQALQAGIYIEVTDTTLTEALHSTSPKIHLLSKLFDNKACHFISLSFFLLARNHDRVY